MSLADVFAPKTEVGDHHPITKLMEDHRTAKGGYQMWSVGCICGGFYDKGVPGKWYIPSEHSAMRLFDVHFKNATGKSWFPETEEEEDEEGDPDIRAVVGAYLTVSAL